MLMMIGPVRFKVLPFNMTENTHTYGADHVEKPVVGARPPLEFVGPSSEAWTIKAVLWPGQYGGGSALTLLNLMVKSGTPQYMMRGDGGLLGWVVVLSVTEKSTHLARTGVGQKIEVDIIVQRTSAPGIGGFIAAISQLF